MLNVKTGHFCKNDSEDSANSESHFSNFPNHFGQMLLLLLMLLRQHGFDSHLQRSNQFTTYNQHNFILEHLYYEVKQVSFEFSVVALWRVDEERDER